MTPSIQFLLIFITDIGDAASLLAITGAGSAYLLYRKSGRAALFLLSAFLLSIFFISVAKLVFIGCQGYLHQPDIHSPSGHAAISTAVFLAYALLMRRRLDAHRQLL